MDLGANEGANRAVTASGRSQQSTAVLSELSERWRAVLRLWLVSWDRRVECDAAEGWELPEGLEDGKQKELAQAKKPAEVFRTLR